MTKAFVGAVRGRVPDGDKQHQDPNAEPRPTIKELQRVKDEVIYKALPIYMRILTAIGDVSELIANRPRKIVR
jgi:hypothetical protein